MIKLVYEPPKGIVSWQMKRGIVHALVDQEAAFTCAGLSALPLPQNSRKQHEKAPKSFRMSPRGILGVGA